MIILPLAHFTQVQFLEELNVQGKILKLYHNHLLTRHPGMANITLLFYFVYQLCLQHYI